MREAMESGALGLSSGLIYPPGVYADELVELCKIVSEYGGLYVTHMRSEGNWVIESIEEAIRIGEKANEKGIKVRLDQYQYKAGAANLLEALPPKYASEGPAVFIILKKLL